MIFDIDEADNPNTNKELYYKLLTINRADGLNNNVVSPRQQSKIRDNKVHYKPPKQVKVHYEPTTKKD